tara:strand:- start:66 stop:668 length:603 start_codon:yes stop_codon:yes gene_type:complete
MSGDLNIRVGTRDKVGGGASRAERKAGMIPAVIYGENKENIHFTVDPRDISKGVHHPDFFTNLFNLDIAGKKETVLVKDIQFHPVKDVPLHIDFLRVGKKSKVKVSVPIIFTNRAASPGLKQGGTLAIAMRDIEVRCTADKIPSQLAIDLTGKEVNVRVTTADLQFDSGVSIADTRQEGATIANIVPPKVKKTTEEAPAS